MGIRWFTAFRHASIVIIATTVNRISLPNILQYIFWKLANNTDTSDEGTKKEMIVKEVQGR